MKRIFKFLQIGRKNEIEEASQALPLNVFKEIIEDFEYMLFIYNFQAKSIIWANHKYKDFIQKLFGEIEEQEIIEKIKTLIDHNDYDKISSEVVNLLKNPSKKDCEIEYRIKYNKKLIYLASKIKILESDESENVDDLLVMVRDVTHQKLIQEKMDESKDEYRNLIELSPDVYIKMSMSGKIISINDAILQLTGFKKEEFIGKHFTKIPAARIKSISTYIRLFNQIVKGNFDELIYFEMQTKEGHTIIGEARVTVIDKPGSKKYIQAVIRDITDSKEKESKIKLQETKYQTLVDNMTEGIMVIKGRHCLYSNAAMERLTGFNLRSGRYSELVKSVNKKTKRELIKIYQKLLEGEKEQPFEIEINQKEDKSCWISVRGTPVFWEVKSAIMYFFVDITERKQKEIEIEDRNRELNQVLEAIPDAMIYTDTERRIMRVNRAFVKLFGYSPEEVYGKKIELIYTGKGKYLEQGRLRYNVQAREVYEPYEIKYRKKNGEEFFSETVGTPVLDSHDNLIGLLGIIRDITKRKEAEEKLKLSEASFRDIFENSPVSLWEEDFSELKTYLDNLSEDNRKNLSEYFKNNQSELEKCAAMIKIIKINKKTLELYEVNEDQAFHTSLYKILTEKSYSTFCNEICWLYEKRTIFREETTEKSFSGKKLYIYLEAMIAPGYEDNWNKIYVSIIDISDQKKAEIELLKHRDHLQELVSEQTAEIKDKYEQLQRQYSLIVRREFRIKELRDQVKELRKKLES